MKRGQIGLLLGTAGTALVAGQLWRIIVTQRAALRRLEEQIRRSAYQLRVQECLLDAHGAPEPLRQALKQVAEGAGAEGAVLAGLDRGGRAFVLAGYGTGDWKGETGRERWRVPRVYASPEGRKSILAYEPGEGGALTPEEWNWLARRGIHSLMMTPVLGRDGDLRGMLCAVNLGRRWEDCQVLEWVAHSFLLAMGSLEAYQAIRDMGGRDALTGLNNRNSYEAALPGYPPPDWERLSCIYLDVNGLHELNNQQGHQRGDEMLRCVAQAIRAAFGGEHAYRIGGDEFVAFSPEGEEVVLRRLEELRSSVEGQGYHISVGEACCQRDRLSLPQLIAQAEEAMYRAKRAFYARNDRRGRGRGSGSARAPLESQPRPSENSQPGLLYKNETI